MTDEEKKLIKDALALIKSNPEEVKPMLDGMVLRTAEQEKTFLENYTKDKVGEAVNAKAGEIYTNFHNLVKEKSGIDPGNNEKASDYLTRVLEEKSTLLTEANKKIKDFEDDKVSKDDVVAQINAQLKAVKDELKSEREARKQDEENFKKEKFNSMFQAKVDSALSKIRPMFKKFEDPKVLENNITAELANFKSKYTPKELNGEIVFYEGDTPVLDKETGNMKGIDSLLTEQLGYLVDETKKQNGTGKKPGDPPNVDVDVPQDVRTKVQLAEYLQKDKQMDPNSKEFVEVYNKYSKDLPLHAPQS